MRCQKNCGSQRTGRVFAHFSQLPLGSGATVAALGVLLLAGPANAAPAPLSDPTNTHGWTLDSTVSDEFNGKTLNASKWYNTVQNWRGRAPSVFEPENLSVSSGSLHLRTHNLNLVHDGSFESGNLGPSWTTWGAGTKTLVTRTIEPASVRSYQAALRIEGEGGAEQSVTLQPNTKYRLSGYAKTGQGGKAIIIGIKDYGGVEIGLPVKGASYQLVGQDFITGATGPIRARVYAYNQGGVGAVYADEIAVLPIVNNVTVPLNLGETTTAAGVQSKQVKEYGYYECRMRAAPAASSSSFWLTNGVTEIDVQETFADNAYPPFTHTTMHTNTHHFISGAAASSNAEKIDVSDSGIHNTGVELSSGYHVYGLDWQPNTLTYYFDGKPIRTMQNVYNTVPENVLLDTEVFPEWSVGPPSGDNVVMDVDYVRHWK